MQAGDMIHGCVPGRDMVCRSNNEKVENEKGTEGKKDRAKRCEKTGWCVKKDRGGGFWFIPTPQNHILDSLCSHQEGTQAHTHTHTHTPVREHKSFTKQHVDIWNCKCKLSLLYSSHAFYFCFICVSFRFSLCNVICTPCVRHAVCVGSCSCVV